MRNLMLRLHKGEGPFFGFAKRFIVALMRFSFTPPAILKPVFRFLYHLHYALVFGFRQLLNIVYCGPLFKARCQVVGKNLSIWSMPAIVGPVELFIGDDVEIFGHLGVTSGRIVDQPRLVIGHRVDIGHNIQITVNQEVVIEDEVNIASGVRIVDTDAHPRDTEARAKGLPPPPAEIKPVHIGKRVWLGQNCLVMKGVTIGEGAVIGVNSVVVTDIPPYAVAMGNPARVVVKDVRATPANPSSYSPSQK